MKKNIFIALLSLLFALGFAGTSWAIYCGDGAINQTWEECDDGNNVDGDGCSADCTFELEPMCGDGVLDDGEDCDDGNLVDGDGCSANCTFEPMCGDDVLDPGEECDDGNNMDGDGCSAECTLEEIGGEGCTPGYWKQEHHFDSWMVYTPDTLFSDVFENAFPGKTLLQVLKKGGGGIKALGRHTVAALLSATSLDVTYDLEVCQVIGIFNDAYLYGSRRDIKDAKNVLEFFNEQGCPLN